MELVIKPPNIDLQQRTYKVLFFSLFAFRYLGFIINPS